MAELRQEEVKLLKAAGEAVRRLERGEGKKEEHEGKLEAIAAAIHAGRQAKHETERELDHAELVLGQAAREAAEAIAESEKRQQSRNTTATGKQEDAVRLQLEMERAQIRRRRRQAKSTLTRPSDSK